MRDRQRREPLGQHPDDRHALGGKVEHHRHHDRQEYRDEHRGDLLEPALENQDQGQREAAHREGRHDGLTIEQALDEPRQLVDEAVRVDRESEQLRQLTHDDRQRQPVHVADLRRLGQEVSHHPELGDPGEHHERPDEQRQHRGQGDRGRRVAVGQDERQDRRGDHRSQRGVWPEHEDARGPEDGVADKTQDRGVEAGDRRKPSQLRVGHSLGHQQGGEDDTCHDVLGEPRPLVGPGGGDARYPGRGQAGCYSLLSAHVPVPSRSRCGPGSHRRGDRGSPYTDRMPGGPTGSALRRVRAATVRR